MPIVRLGDDLRGDDRPGGGADPESEPALADPRSPPPEAAWLPMSSPVHDAPAPIPVPAFLLARIAYAAALGPSLRSTRSSSPRADEANKVRPSACASTPYKSSSHSKHCTLVSDTASRHRTVRSYDAVNTRDGSLCSGSSPLIARLCTKSTVTLASASSSNGRQAPSFPQRSPTQRTALSPRGCQAVEYTRDGTHFVACLSDRIFMVE